MALSKYYIHKNVDASALNVDKLSFYNTFFFIYNLKITTMHDF